LASLLRFCLAAILKSCKKKNIANPLTSAKIGGLDDELVIDEVLEFDFYYTAVAKKDESS
jgi:hypothetical protein